jgi:hypothetical protein
MALLHSSAMTMRQGGAVNKSDVTRGGWPLLTRGLTDRLKRHMRERFGEPRKTARMMRPKSRYARPQ